MFDIEPFHRVGPLQFQMSRFEVEQALPKIDRAVKSADGVIDLYNFDLDLMAQISANTDALIEVGFGHRAKDVSFQGILFFEQQPIDVLIALLSIDSTAISGHGSIVFPALGLSLTGFIDAPEETKSMTAFAHGVWDDMLPSMRKFRL